MRVLCLYFPRLALQIACESRPELADRPAATLQGAGDTALATSVSGQASVAEVAPGMTAAEARRRCPGAVFLPDMTEECFARLDRLASIIRVRATPLVAIGGPDHVFVDLRGTERLFGNEQTAAARLASIAQTWLRAAPRAGVAESREGALAAARAARFRPIVVPPEGVGESERPFAGYGGQSIAVETTTRCAREASDIAKLLRRAQPVLDGRGEGFREARLTIERDSGTEQYRWQALAYETDRLSDWVADRVGEAGDAVSVRLELGWLCPDARLRPVTVRRAAPAGGLARVGRQFPLRAAG